MPAYSGTIALVLGIIVQVLAIAGVKLPEEFAGQATQAIVAIITAATMIIGIWRLLHTKRVAETATAQVVAQGIAPINGPDKGVVPSETERLNAESLAIARARAAGVSTTLAVPQRP